MSEHTPERLEVLDDRRISVTLPPLIEDCGYTSHCVAMTYGGDERVNSHANARRIVACWNACDGISTDVLESIPGITGPMVSYHELKAERDSLRAVNAELLEALKFYADPGDYKAPFTGGMGSLYFDCGQKARAAIASARKQGEQG